MSLKSPFVFTSSMGKLRERKSSLFSIRILDIGNFIPGLIIVSPAKFTFTVLLDWFSDISCLPVRHDLTRHPQLPCNYADAS